MLLEKQELKELIATTASVCQILQVLAGVLVCRKFIKKGSSNDVSPLPFLCGSVGSFLWFLYGSLIGDTALRMVNVFGVLFFSSYVVAHITFSSKKVTIARQILLIILVTGCIYTYIESIVDPEEAKNKLGVIACVVSITFFAAPLANLAHVIRVKSSESLPFPMIVMSLIVTFLWSVYGYILQDSFIAYPNILAFLLSSFQLSLFALYPPR
ncbi:DNA recombination [Nesidiocoris tenuis]|uniref:Sugar transporter SWEET1 n=1 Tax=Nesidiocoris tenuis TaxID=355587 RepID=A0ABN7AWU8_9HEMI|nr:DNA recombination [Nesidiocoris tenuis]